MTIKVLFRNAQGTAQVPADNANPIGSTFGAEAPGS